jgi:hypothetical protein
VPRVHVRVLGRGVIALPPRPQLSSHTAAGLRWTTVSQSTTLHRQQSTRRLSHASRGNAPCVPNRPPAPLQLLAAGLVDDALYPQLRVSVKLPYQIHDIYLALTMPRSCVRSLRC